MLQPLMLGFSLDLDLAFEAKTFSALTLLILALILLLYFEALLTS